MKVRHIIHLLEPDSTLWWNKYAPTVPMRVYTRLANYELFNATFNALQDGDDYEL